MTTAVQAPWHTRTFVGFDTETTGVNPHEDRIVTASLVFVGPDGLQAREDRNWLINPGIDIPEQATAVHHVTTEHAQQEGMPAAQGVKEIVDALTSVFRAGLPLIVFNAPYDLTLLDAEADRYGLDSFIDDEAWAEAVVLDPIVIDRALDRYRPGKRTLTAMSEHYGIRLDDAHTADADSLAACRIARRLTEKEPRLAALDPAGVMAKQKEWRRTWAEGFQSYLRGVGKTDAIIDGSWPLSVTPDN